MSTVMAIFLCLAAGSVLHLYQILTVLVWVARHSAGEVPADSATPATVEAISGTMWEAGHAPPRPPIVHCPIASVSTLDLGGPARSRAIQSDWSLLIEEAGQTAYRLPEA